MTTNNMCSNSVQSLAEIGCSFGPTTATKLNLSKSPMIHAFLYQLKIYRIAKQMVEKGFYDLQFLSSLKLAQLFNLNVA